MFELSTNDIIVGGFKRTYCLLDETYSIVRKGHKRKPEQANGDCLIQGTIATYYSLFAIPCRDSNSEPNHRQNVIFNIDALDRSAMILAFNNNLIV